MPLLEYLLKDSLENCLMSTLLFLTCAQFAEVPYLYWWQRTIRFLSVASPHWRKSGGMEGDGSEIVHDAFNKLRTHSMSYTQCMTASSSIVQSTVGSPHSFPTKLQHFRRLRFTRIKRILYLVNFALKFYWCKRFLYMYESCFFNILSLYKY